MRLKKEQIEQLSQQIFAHLKDKELIKIKVSEDKVLSRIQQAITQDLEAEVKLDEEVEQVMAQYRRQIAQGGLNERELFLKIKKELAKKKGVVL